MSSIIYYLFGWNTENEVKDPLKDKQKHQKYLSCKAIEKGVKLKKNQKKEDLEPKKRKTWGRPSQIISGSNFHSIL